MVDTIRWTATDNRPGSGVCCPADEQETQATACTINVSGSKPVGLRLDLAAIDDALLAVEREWARVDIDLKARGMGKLPFTADVRRNMVCAYTHLDRLVEERVAPFSDIGMDHMLELNHRVHYGVDEDLRAEYVQAVEAATEKFNANIEAIASWYGRHASHGDHPMKLAAETYVSIVGQPQLFVEGNHRTGALISSWINLTSGYPPFVLSADNAVAYFAPSAAIKQFADRSTWRGRQRLPKYRKSFREFWERHVDAKYVLPTD